MYMRQILLVVVVFLGVFSRVVTAEDKPLPLQPALRPAVNGETQCRPLFVKAMFGAPTIVFAYRTPDGKITGNSVLATQVRVEIVEGQAPTYEKTSVGGGDGAIFRLSQAECEKDRACLSELTPTKAAQ
jgi:hypothetical protein